MSDSVSRSDLVAVFSKSVGEEKASELVARAMSDSGVTAHVFSMAVALTVLQKLGESPGLIGIVARCASAKMVVKAR